MATDPNVVEQPEFLSDMLSSVACHIGVEVPDMEEGLRFYRDILGFEEVWRLESGGKFMEDLTGIPNVECLTVQLNIPGGSRLELQTYSPHGTIGEAKVNNQGLNHLSWAVKDCWKEYERLKALDVKFACEPADINLDEHDPDHPMNGWTVAYFDDPWGTVLEILSPQRGRTIKTGERPPSS